MIYVVDTNCFRILESYYPSRFPGFWREFDRAVDEGVIVSVREVYKELERGNTAPHIEQWAEEHRDFFRDPTEQELGALAAIFQVPHFQGLVGPRQLLTGAPVADPFLIAAAIVADGCVVTQERHKPNSAKIPTVCDHFQVACKNLEDMLTDLDWVF